MSMWEAVRGRVKLLHEVSIQFFAFSYFFNQFFFGVAFIWAQAVTGPPTRDTLQCGLVQLIYPNQWHIRNPYFVHGMNLFADVGYEVTVVFVEPGNVVHCGIID